jgi:4-hydroxy-2-oxoheptanedioate aldolase
MLENTVRSRLAEGQLAVSGWMVEPSPTIAEALAAEDFDAITVDLQHGGVGFDQVVSLFQAMAVHGTVPFVRVPWNEPWAIARALDAGALGIICPMINSAEDCRRFIDSARYHPLGSRSYGPYRASIAHGPGYASAANATVLTFAMIETVQAVEDLDGILAVEGLDGVFVGPSDLSQSMGLSPRPDWEDGPVLERIEYLLASAKAAGIIPGISTDKAAYARRMADLGFRFIAVGSDLGFAQNGARAAIQAIKG